MPVASIETFWRRCRAALPDETLPDTYQVWYFGDSPALADELTALVLAGTKTATAGLLWSYAAEREPMPEVGGYSVITSFEGAPLCMLQTTAVEVLPFDQVGADFAWLEGEDDRSLDSWRAGHWRFFGRECQALGREPSEQMPVVCERFRLVYPLP